MNLPNPRLSTFLLQLLVGSDFLVQMGSAQHRSTRQCYFIGLRQRDSVKMRGFVALLGPFPSGTAGTLDLLGPRLCYILH